MATFDLLSGLPIEVDGYSLEGLQAEISPEFTRFTTIIAITGGGLEGIGEDVVYTGEEHLEYERLGAVHDLSGSRSLGELCELIESLDLFPTPPAMEASRLYRIWGFESAALDLALRQNGLSLAQALRREARPMRYVASTRLGEPPTLEPVDKRLALDPTLRFKLDATSSWTPEIFAQLVATGAVDSIDFKGMYRGTSVDQQADPVLYERVVEAFPDAWLEDPDLSSAAAMAVLADQHDRITWDAPIHGIADIEALPFAPRMVNIKPVADRPAERALRDLRLLRGTCDRGLRRRPDRARRGPRPGSVPRGAVSSGHAQRPRARRLQPGGSARRPAAQPANSGLHRTRVQVA